MQVGLVEQLEKLASLVNTAGNEHGIAVTTLKPVARFHVYQDVGDDFVQTRFARQHLLHRAPPLFELRLGEIGQPFGFEIKPLINLRLR